MTQAAVSSGAHSGDRVPPVALLLGSHGFLGRHCGAALIQAGWEVRTMPRGQDLSSVSPQDWAEALAGVQVVVNAAGRTAGSLTELTRANVLLLAGVLEAAAACGVRLIHLSSAAEYGRTPEGHAAHEDDPARPLSPYGATKLAATVLLDEGVRAGRVDAVALRLTNPVGAGMAAGGLPGRAAQELRAAVQEGRLAVRFGPLGALRDLISARDAARAVVHLLPGQPGASVRGIVNVGSGEARPVRELVQRLAVLVGFAGELQEDAPGSPRSGDVPYQRADVRRLQTSGFQAQDTLDDALSDLLGRTAE